MKRWVLAGAGHAHAQVLRAWARQPLAGVELVVVSPQALAPYSGMVPGWLAGRHRLADTCIDFAALCQAAGARWWPGELQALDAGRQRLQLVDGRVLDYDQLSLNLGATLAAPPPCAATVLALRPLATLHTTYPALLARWQQAPAQQRPCTLTAVGGGAAGFEALLAVLARLRALRPDRPLRARLVSRSPELLPDLCTSARTLALNALQHAGVALALDTTWQGGDSGPQDTVLWATGAQAHAWQTDPARRGGLAVDDQGFVAVDMQLRSTSHRNVWAVGDCARLPTALPKAGVYAVRMGPVLAHNLRATLQGQALQTYRPQRQFLRLLSTADGQAIATRGRLAAQGRWAARWKDHIDHRFVRGFVRTTSGGADLDAQP